MRYFIVSIVPIGALGSVSPQLVYIIKVLIILKLGVYRTDRKSMERAAVFVS